MFGGYIWGSLADLYGRRAVLLVSLTVNGLGGLASSFSQTFPVFLVLRFISGLGYETVSKLKSPPHCQPGSRMNVERHLCANTPPRLSIFLFPVWLRPLFAVHNEVIGGLIEAHEARLELTPMLNFLDQVGCKKWALTPRILFSQNQVPLPNFWNPEESP